MLFTTYSTFYLNQLKGRANVYEQAEDASKTSLVLTTDRYGTTHPAGNS